MARKKPFTSAMIKKLYKPDMSLGSMTRRAAHFYDWAAKVYPLQYISWVIALRAVSGFWRTSERSKEVELYRGRGSAIRKILIDEYGREFTTQRGIGARATVGDDDLAKTEVVKKSRTIQSAHTAAERTLGLIKNVNSIKDPEDRKLVTNVRNVMRSLAANNSARKLLPPGYEDKMKKAVKAAAAIKKSKKRK